MTETTASQLHRLEWYSGVPRSIKKQTSIGLAILLVTFGGFGVWAATAPLAAAVIANGSFVATGENKIVQHFEGGIVKDLLVREGDRVVAGQDLLLLDETAARANAQQLTMRKLRLETIRARLHAEANGLQVYTAPPSVMESLGDPAVADLYNSQKNNFEGARDKLANESALLEQNIASLEFRIEGREGQIDSMERQLALLQEDLRVMSELQEKGIAPLSAVRTLERSIANAEGDIARLESEVLESRAQIEKYRREVIQLRDAVQQAALDELQAVEAELDAVSQQIQAANNILRRTTITAPVDGTIVRMFYHTTGGVIASGEPIFEILPSDVPLIVEVKIPRMQIDEVNEGQEATVRLTGLNQRTTPVLTGEVVYISADSIVDPLDANSEVYVARVSIAPAQLARIEGDFTPTPGMPAEILIQTAERTFFDYLVKPVTDSMSRAFREI
jgi:HlyD family type I secretion membrane fusion protein